MIKVLFALFTVSALLLRTAAAAADFRMSPSCGGPRIAAGELPERDAALRTVRRFYEEYLAAWEGDRRKQEEVCERYVARSLREEIRAAQAAGLDYDPYVQAQDCGPETLARLRVECDSADCCRCRVFLWDGWRRACREVVVRAVCGAQGYRIAAIEDPNLPGGVSGADATRAGEACGR